MGGCFGACVCCIKDSEACLKITDSEVTKMTAVVESDFCLVIKWLDLCQAADQTGQVNQHFSRHWFHFFLLSRHQVKGPLGRVKEMNKKKKKASSSTKRRNARRRKGNKVMQL